MTYAHSASDRSRRGSQDSVSVNPRTGVLIGSEGFTHIVTVETTPEEAAAIVQRMSKRRARRHS